MQREVTHRSADTVWLFDYPSLEAMDSNPNRLVLLSERDWNIVQQATKDIDRFQARIWVEATGQRYLTVDDLDFETFQGWVSDLRIQLEDYAMIEELLAEIRDAILAVANRECCPTGGAGSGIFNSGSRGAGLTPEIINPYTENLELEEPPVGFDSWASYRAHKCNASADLVQSFKVDLLSLSNLIPEGKMFTVIVAELVAVLLTPIPFDDVASLVGWLVVGAFEYSLLAELSTGVQDDEGNLRCILYSSSNASNAQADFRERITELIGEVTGISLAQDWMESIVDNLTPNDAFNRIFEAGSTTIQDADCSGCLDTSPYTVNYGTETSENPSNPIVIEMVYEAGYGCGTEARNAGINFSSPVQITGITIDGLGVGECSGGFLFGYGVDPGDEAGVDAPDAADSTYPSVEDPTVAIYSMYVLCAVTSGNPVLTVTYIT